MGYYNVNKESEINHIAELFFAYWPGPALMLFLWLLMRFLYVYRIYNNQYFSYHFS